MKSVHSFLLWRLLGWTSLILLLAVGTVYQLVARTLESQFDNNLSHRIQAFASILFQHDNELSFEFSGQLMPEYLPGPHASYFELWLTDGRIVERSESLEALGDVDLELPSAALPLASHWTALMPDGRMGRFVSQEILVHHVYPEEGPDRPMPARLHVVIAMGREELLASERLLLAYCSLFACAVLALIAVMMRWNVNRGLAPANQLASKLDKIKIDDLPDEFDAGDLPCELSPIAHKADALIQRAVAALRRERRTTADIAHELRTPISELLTVSEVALRSPDDASSHFEALGTVRDVSQRMARAISTLLKLSHIENGGRSLKPVALNLSRLVQHELMIRARLRIRRDLEVHDNIPQDASIHGEQESMRIVISNLIDNALNYSTKGSRIDCDFGSDGQHWELRISNPAPQISHQEMSSVTQPFWRRDRARSDHDHFGLGLALSSALADKNSMTLNFTYESGQFIASLRGSSACDSSLPKMRLLG